MSRELIDPTNLPEKDLPSARSKKYIQILLCQQRQFRLDLDIDRLDEKGFVHFSFSGPNGGRRSTSEKLYKTPDCSVFWFKFCYGCPDDREEVYFIVLIPENVLM